MSHKKEIIENRCQTCPTLALVLDMYTALLDVNTALAVIEITEGLAPEVRRVSSSAYAKFQEVMARIHGPDSEWARAVAEKANILLETGEN